MNISVPDDLRAEMARFDDSENWSAIAAEAFRKRVAERIELWLRSQKGGDMNQVVDRLKASKVECEAQAAIKSAAREAAAIERLELSPARIAGEFWAKETASYEQLAKIGDLREREGARLIWLLHGHAAGLASDLGENAQEFWTTATGRDINDIDVGFVNDFIDGAYGVWRDVKDQI